MGSKIKETARKTEQRVDLQRGIVDHFLLCNDNRYDEKNEHENEIDNENDGEEEEEKRDILMDQMVARMIDLINKKAPISDDMLLMCWVHELKTTPKNEERKLRNVLYSTVSTILRKRENKRDLIWFKLYLLNSAIWYELDDSWGTELKPNSTNPHGNINPNVKSQLKEKKLKIVCQECEHSMQLITAQEVLAYIATGKGKGLNMSSMDVGIVDGGLLSSEVVSCTVCKHTIDNGDFVYHCRSSNCCSYCARCSEDHIENDEAVAGGPGADVPGGIPGGGGSGGPGGSDDHSGDNETIVYNNIVAMAQDVLTQNKKALKLEIDKLRFTNTQAFEAMINFQEYIVHDKISLELGLRQDNDKILTYPNQLSFDVKKLDALKLKDFYDSKVYLSNLMITANALNDEFHRTMQQVILKNDDLCEYQEGPLKKIDRALAKSESDYAHLPFPTTSHVIDIIRYFFFLRCHRSCVARVACVVFHFCFVLFLL